MNEETYLDALEYAWVIIANAYQGDWSTAPEEWRVAAERWRDETFHPLLDQKPCIPVSCPPIEETIVSYTTSTEYLSCDDSRTWPAVESRYSPYRREWNLLIRRPFYMNLRLGLTQNALWVGKQDGEFVTIFNRFPILSKTP